MKKVIISCMAFFLSAASVSAGGNLDLKKVTDGTFSAEYISGIKPIEGTDLYARISDDGQRIVRYSFKTGKQVDVHTFARRNAHTYLYQFAKDI